MIRATPVIQLIATGLLIGLASSCGATGKLLGPDLFGTRIATPPSGAAPGLDYEPAFGVEAGTGSITVSGSFWGDGCGDRLETRFVQDARRLILRLNFIVLVKDPICLQWIVITKYTAVLPSLSPGTCTVEVWHDHRRADIVIRFDLGTATVR